MSQGDTAGSVALGGDTARLPEPWPTPRPATLLGIPMMPEVSECRVEPRTVEALTALASSATANEVPDFGLGDRVTDGVPADEATTAAVVRTVREFGACLRAGDDLRLWALYSDDAIRAMGLIGVFDVGSDGRLDFFEYEVRTTVTVSVGTVLAFPDGRAGAVVVLDGETAFVTFVRVGDRWLVDAFDDRSPVGVGTPTG